MSARTIIALVALALVTAPVLVAGPAAAAPEEPPCDPFACKEVVVDPFSCPVSPKEEKRFRVSFVILVVRYCSSPYTTTAADNPCEGWNPTPTAKITGDDCLVYVVFPEQNCVGPWYHTETGNVGPVGYERTVCDPPGGGTTAHGECEPLQTGTPADEVCIHIENKPPNCVGPWTNTISGSVGPVSWRIHHCSPPGGGPVIA